MQYIYIYIYILSKNNKNEIIGSDSSEPTTPGYLIHVYWSKGILCLGASANRATSVQYPSIKGILTLYSHAKVHQSHQIIDKILLSQNFSVCLVLGEKCGWRKGKENFDCLVQKKRGGKIDGRRYFPPRPTENNPPQFTRVKTNCESRSFNFSSNLSFLKRSVPNQSSLSSSFFSS